VVYGKEGTRNPFFIGPAPRLTLQKILMSVLIVSPARYALYPDIRASRLSNLRGRDGVSEVVDPTHWDAAMQVDGV